MENAINNYWTLVIPIILYCISGALDAVMDTLKDHFSVSIFQNDNPYFWNPAISWKNKYIDNNPTLGHRKINILGISFNYPDALSDAWHIFKIAREGANISAITTGSLIGLSLSIQSIYITPIILLGYIAVLATLRNMVFSFFYDKILVS